MLALTIVAVARAEPWVLPGGLISLTMPKGWGKFEDTAASPQEFVFWPAQTEWPPPIQCQLNIRNAPTRGDQAVANELVRRWDMRRVAGPVSDFPGFQVAQFENVSVQGVQVASLRYEAAPDGEDTKLLTRQFVLAAEETTIFGSLNCSAPSAASPSVQNEIEAFASSLTFSR